MVEKQEPGEELKIYLIPPNLFQIEIPIFTGEMYTKSVSVTLDQKLLDEEGICWCYADWEGCRIMSRIQP